MNGTPHTHELNIRAVSRYESKLFAKLAIEYGDTTTYALTTRRSVRRACIRAIRRHDRGTQEATRLAQKLDTRMGKAVKGWKGIADTLTTNDAQAWGSELVAKSNHPAKGKENAA